MMMPSRDAVDSTVQFFIPQAALPDGDVPSSLDQYWPWTAKHFGVGENGRYTWTLKTYLYLQQSQVPVRLVTRFPSRGIVVSHRDFLPLHLRPRSDVFLVCIKPDRKEHTWAHYYIAQNEKDRIFSGPLADRAQHVMHWPQAQLLSRSSARGDQCANVRYFGRSMNLAAELMTPEWAEKLRALGFDWSVVPSSKWNDYSDVDVTVSVRTFREKSTTRDPLLDPDSKPPSKLINSWLAGVPAIVGRESAYRSLRQSTLDYLEVETAEELLSALSALRENSVLYNAMVAHGYQRSRQFTTEAVLSQWRSVVETAMIPAYQQWMRKGRVQRQLHNLRSASVFLATPSNIAAIRIYRGA
jgi:hypothetical protein